MVRSCRRHRADGWPRARSVRSPDGPVKRAGAVPGDAAAPADRPCWLSFPPMTDRGLPIVDGAPACPFVAFEDDRDGRGQAPDHRHRCFAEPRPAPRALAHQEAYCLSSAFPVCPTFQDWARREAATARAAQLEIRAAGRSRSRRQPVAAAARARAASRAEHRHPAAPAAAPQSAARLGGPAAVGGRRGRRAGASRPSFLAARHRPNRPTSAPPRRAAYGAASRGLAGSAADRLAGGYVDDADEPVAPSPCGVRGGVVRGAGRQRLRTSATDPRSRRPPQRRSAAAYQAANDASPEAGRRALEPVGPTGQPGLADVGWAEAGRRVQAAAGSRRAVRAGLGGAAPLRGVPVAADPRRACRRSAASRASGWPRSRWSSRPSRCSSSARCCWASAASNPGGGGAPADVPAGRGADRRRRSRPRSRRRRRRSTSSPGATRCSRSRRSST